MPQLQITKSNQAETSAIVWEQQSGEFPETYEAFRQYCANSDLTETPHQFIERVFSGDPAMLEFSNDWWHRRSSYLSAVAHTASARAQVVAFGAVSNVVETAMNIHHRLSAEIQQMEADGVPTTDARFATVLKHWERVGRIVNGAVSAMKSSGVTVNTAVITKVGNEPVAIFGKEWDPDP